MFKSEIVPLSLLTTKLTLRYPNLQHRPARSPAADRASVPIRRSSHRRHDPRRPSSDDPVSSHQYQGSSLPDRLVVATLRRHAWLLSIFGNLVVLNPDSSHRCRLRAPRWCGKPGRFSNIRCDRTLGTKTCRSRAFAWRPERGVLAKRCFHPVKYGPRDGCPFRDLRVTASLKQVLAAVERRGGIDLP